MSGEATYNCKICHSVLKNKYKAIRNHLEKAHKLKMSEYEALHEPGESFVITTKREQHYFCNICEKDLQYTKSSLRNHLETLHNTTLAIYEENFGKLANIRRRKRYEKRKQLALLNSFPPVHSSPFAHLQATTTPTSYLCPRPSCSFALPKPAMKLGDGARHLIERHGFTARDVGVGRIKWEKVRY